MDWGIQETVISLESDMGTLSVVRFNSGVYGLTVDGEPIKALFWHAGQLEDCLTTAARMAGLDVPKRPRLQGEGPVQASGTGGGQQSVASDAGEGQPPPRLEGREEDVS